MLDKECQPGGYVAPTNQQYAPYFNTASNHPLTYHLREVIPHSKVVRPGFGYLARKPIISRLQISYFP